MSHYAKNQRMMWT